MAISMNMKLPFIILSFAAARLFCIAADADASDIDPREIRSTQIAETLLAHGFQEVPEDSGIYRRNEVRLAGFLKEFDLSVEQLEPIPGSPSGEWMRTTKFRGDSMVLRAPEPLMPDSLVNVTVNLGYIRPKNLWVGMNISRAEAALENIGARNVSRKVAVATGDAWKVTVSCLLPDNSGLVLTAIRPRMTKPTSGTITQLIIGEKGKGFENWDNQNRMSMKTYSIQMYRSSQE